MPYPKLLSNSNNSDMEESGRQDTDSDLSTDSSRRSRPNVLIVITFVLELIILGIIATLAYFLRWTNVFPMRRSNFSCLDPELSHSAKESPFLDFAFQAEVSDEAIYSLSVCVPPFVILISEIGMWAFGTEPQRSISILCGACRVPQIIRRIFRFIGVFLFGAMALMVFADVIKLMTGRLRPNFLDICQINRSKCALQNQSGGDELCLVKNTLHLRNARTSFPSMNAALTSYAAVFLVIYIHYGVGTHTLKLVRVFLAMIFCMMSLLCGLVEIGLYKSFWTDVVVGFGMGIVMAAYLGGFVLHNFSEHTMDKKLLRALKAYLIQHGGAPGRPGNMRYDPLFGGSGFHIPRVHVPLFPEDSNHKHRTHRPQDTFQRDLSHVVEHYRRGSPAQASTHM